MDRPQQTVNEVHDEQLTVGDRIADRVASFVGSWSFVIGMTALFLAWIALNSIVYLITHFDPFPFILLNLCLSFLAGYTGPFIMMSQNRQSAKDRIAAEHDYQTNVAAKLEVEEVLVRLETQSKHMLDILERIGKIGEMQHVHPLHSRKPSTRTPVESEG